MSNTARNETYPARIGWVNNTGGDLAASAVVAVLGLVGVVLTAVANGVRGVLQIGGEHELAATTAEAWAFGARLFWNANTSKLTAAETSGLPYAGRASKAKAAGVTTGCVLLNWGAAAAGGGAALDWQESVLDAINLVTTEPAAPTVGDRYLNTATGASSVTAQAVVANQIATWTGAGWTLATPSKGMAVWTEDDSEILVFTSSWVNLQTLNQATVVANAAAATAVAADLTAGDPTLAAADIDDQSGGTASETHQLVALAGGGADALSDAEALKINANLATIAAEHNGLKVDVEANETAVEAAIDDLATQKGIVDALIADNASIRTQLNAALAALKTAGLMASA